MLTLFEKEYVGAGGMGQSTPLYFLTISKVSKQLNSEQSLWILLKLTREHFKITWICLWNFYGNLFWN